MSQNITKEKTTFTASDAKNQFGRLLDAARRRPITIEKNGRPVAVVLSLEDYNESERASDAYWGERAEKARKGGFLGVKESAEYLRSVLHAKG